MQLGTLKEKETPTRGAMANYRVIIDPKVHQKIMHWVRKADGEISGLGKLQIGNDGLLFVSSAFLLEQENTSSTTDITPQAVAKAMYEHKDEPGHLNFWWHSHVNMDVFWSGTDLDTIREIGDQGFVLATVFNKKNEILSALYRKAEGLFPEDFKNNLPTSFQNTVTQEELDKWDADFNEKCKKKTYNWQNTQSSYGHGNYHGTTNDALEEYYRRYPRMGMGADMERGIDEPDLFSVKELEDDKTEDELEEKINPCVEVMIRCTDYRDVKKNFNRIINMINQTKFHDKERKVELRKEIYGYFNRTNAEISRKGIPAQ